MAVIEGVEKLYGANVETPEGRAPPLLLLPRGALPLFGRF